MGLEEEEEEEVKEEEGSSLYEDCSFWFKTEDQFGF